MNVDELASAFDGVLGEGSRIDHAQFVGEHVGLLDEPETVRLVPPWDPAAARDLRDLIDTAVQVFGRDGPGTPEERWCRFALKHAPQLVKPEPAELLRLVRDDEMPATVTVLTGRIHDVAKASARVVRKCRHLASRGPMRQREPEHDATGESALQATRTWAVAGWTRAELCEAVKGEFSESTFQRIRKDAGVDGRERSGLRFTPEEVRRMTETAEKSTKPKWRAAARVWRELLAAGG